RWSRMLARAPRGLSAGFPTTPAAPPPVLPSLTLPARRQRARRPRGGRGGGGVRRALPPVGGRPAGREGPGAVSGPTGRGGGPGGVWLGGSATSSTRVKKPAGHGISQQGPPTIRRVNPGRRGLINLAWPRGGRRPVKVHDSMRESAAEFLRPGETIQAVFAAM